MMYFIVTAASLIMGYSAYYFVNKIIEEMPNNALSKRFFTPIILQIICIISFNVIYTVFGISGQFFLYAGFSFFLLILTFTDLLDSIIDDRVIILGIIYTLVIQTYLGNITFAALGALIGAIFMGALFIAGKYFFTGANDIDVTEVVQAQSPLAISFPLAPSITLAVIINALIPDGLYRFLLEVIYYIQTNNYAFMLVLSVVMIVLMFVWRNNKEYHHESTDDTPALGDGDITLAVFLGTVLGWQSLIAVLWLGMVIHSVFGVAISAKRSLQA